MSISSSGEKVGHVEFLLGREPSKGVDVEHLGQGQSGGGLLTRRNGGQLLLGSDMYSMEPDLLKKTLI